MGCSDPVIGRVVYSKAGRDKGRLFVILGTVNEDFVLLADGELRPIEKPKKKRMKHVRYTDLTAHQIADTIRGGKKPRNQELKDAIAKFSDMITARSV